MVLRVTALCVAVVAIAACGVCVCAQINEAHVRFVDYSAATGHYLFRMGLPANFSDALAVDQLHTLFTQRAAAANLSFYKSRADYALVDVCLLTTETADIAAEQKYYATHPQLGAFIHWPIYGLTSAEMKTVCAAYGVPSKQCASGTRQLKDFTAAARETIATALPTWETGDHLDALVAKLFDLVHTPVAAGTVNALARLSAAHTNPNTRLRAHYDTRNHNVASIAVDTRPLVVIVHCVCGCDRTGEVMGSYMMHYLNENFTQVMTYDEGVPGRHITYENQVLSQWYCEYLRITGAFHFADCGNCKPFTCK